MTSGLKILNADDFPGGLPGFLVLAKQGRAGAHRFRRHSRGNYRPGHSLFDASREYGAAVTISGGTNLLVGTDPAEIVAVARDVLAGKGKAGRIPPLWDGQAARRIVEVLLRLVPRQKAP